MSRQDKRKIERMESNSSFMALAFSCLSVFCLVMVFAIISSIMKYFMAAKAMQSGDVGSAALIMSEGSYRQPTNYSTQPTGSLITLKL